MRVDEFFKNIYVLRNASCVQHSVFPEKASHFEKPFFYYHGMLQPESYLGGFLDYDHSQKYKKSTIMFICVYKTIHFEKYMKKSK